MDDDQNVYISENGKDLFPLQVHNPTPEEDAVELYNLRKENQKLITCLTNLRKAQKDYLANRGDNIFSKRIDECIEECDKLLGDLNEIE